MDGATALESLSSLLTSLSDSPYSIALHAQHIQFASLPLPELAGQLDSAVQLFLNFYAATDQVWLPFLQEKIQGLGISEDFETSDEPPLVNLQGISVEAVLDVLESFRKAEDDYLLISILRKKIKLLTLLHTSYVSSSSNPEFEPLLSEDAVRSAIADTVSKGSSHLTECHLLWELQVAWELDRLENKGPQSPERETLKAHIEALHLEHLKQPHSTNDQTLQSYSSFISAYYSPNEYESHLVPASKIRTGPAKAWDKKERYELALRNSPSRDSYQAYILSEQRAKPQNADLLNALYERAIAEYASKRWDAASNGSDAQLEDLENALRSFWCGYIDSVRAADEGKSELQVIRRAVRSVPGSGEVWARYIRALERSEDDADEEMEDDSQPTESVADVYVKVLSTSLVQQHVEQIVPLVLAKAGFEKRRLKDQEGFQALLKTLEDGISLVRHAAKEGDPRMTLEKYLAGVYLNLEIPLVEQALALWQSTAKYYKANYLAWNKYSELLIAQSEYTRARALFKDVSFKSLDWPEALWQAWTEFEHLHGSLEDIEHCLEKVKGLSAKLEKKRAQETAEVQRAWIEASQVNLELGRANASTADVVADQTVVDSVEEGPQQSDRKRKAEETDGPDNSKRVKLDDKTNLRRDRENSTVFVSGLVAGTTEDELVTLFRDCGKIREIKITELSKSSVATVEFFDRESVPAALTKDKKRIKNEEIAVHLAWQSTLYVTNFPEKSDDASIRAVFSPHGEIFDVRWPSKKYKSTRRFCYVQYTSPAAAKSALSLHGHESEPGRTLTVYISNPERKKERTDAMANAREIYVAGLSKSANQNDLKKLFEKFGTISGIRMILDDKGNSKGFAFVEFENEGFANAALAANNQELKKRRIAVTLADTRVQPREREGTASSSQARRSRTLRVKNLPSGTQEGLLQQALEKHADIKRVEVFNDKNEAIIELASVAEAGKLLLIPEPITFGDRTLELIEEDLPASSRDSAKSGPMFMPRGATGRPRVGIGSKKTVVPKKGTSSVAAGPSTSVNNPNIAKGQDDFRRMLNPGT